MKKRIIASILTFIMLMTMLPTAAFAADGESTETGGSTTPEAAIYLDQQHGADDHQTNDDRGLDARGVDPAAALPGVFLLGPL